MPERRPTVCALLSRYDGDNELPVFLRFTRASLPQAARLGERRHLTRGIHGVHETLKRVTNEEICLRDQPHQVLPDPRLSTLIRSHPNRR